MRLIDNLHRGSGLMLEGVPRPSVDAGAVADLLGKCPAHGETPLLRAGALEARLGGAELWVKDERGRMGLGSFKALGAAYVIAHAAQAVGGEPSRALVDRCFVTASAGNHGMSVAAGARIFGARAVVYLAETVPEDFAVRLREKGAKVVRAGADYAASMAAAEDAAALEGWTLLSDSSWDGYVAIPHRLMEGYLQMAAECAAEMEAPSHILLQAGVGGLAGAFAAYAREVWGAVPRIIVVEPEVAPALYESIRAGAPVETDGPVSSMGRLDCKAPSLIALQGLSRDADVFALISEEEADAAMPVLADAGLSTTPSGGAGLAAALADPAALGIGAGARVLAVLSETPE